MLVTGVAIVLLILEAAVPQLRGMVTWERDGERSRTRTVSIHLAFRLIMLHVQIYLNRQTLALGRTSMYLCAMKQHLQASSGEYSYLLILLSYSYWE